jgi:haloalkane dehalogenase
LKILRTSDERFIDLANFSFPPHYVEVDHLRIHYVDEGDSSRDPVLLMHGEPTWCYLYRHMIPVFVQHGYRAIAPDLVGFGRSDKPADRRDYTYQRHVEWMTRWLLAIDLRNITLVCQDWGSLIGLRLAAEQSDRFARIVLANGGLPAGDWRPSSAFRVWRLFAKYSPWFPISRIVAAGCQSRLSPDAAVAYDAPFPDKSYKQGARAFPALVPTRPDDPAVPANRRAWEVFERWDKPFMTAFSDGDPITRDLDRAFQRRVPGAAGQPHTVIRDAGHFLQEDKGVELAHVVVQFIKVTR